MPLPKSINAYLDCTDAYTRAVESVDAGGPGVRIRLGSWAQANYFRMRMNNARAINRRDNTDVYSPGDPLYKGSVWDALMVTIREVDGEHYVYVEPHGVTIDAIEEIPSDDNSQMLLAPPKPLAIGAVQILPPLVTRR